MSERESAQVLDVTGLTCPLPVLRLKQALRSMMVGEVVKVVATDKSTEHDIPSYCRQTGHQLVEINTENNKQYIFWIEKAE